MEATKDIVQNSNVEDHHEESGEVPCGVPPEEQKKLEALSITSFHLFYLDRRKNQQFSHMCSL